MELMINYLNMQNMVYNDLYPSLSHTHTKRHTLSHTHKRAHTSGGVKRQIPKGATACTSDKNLLKAPRGIAV